MNRILTHARAAYKWLYEQPIFHRRAIFLLAAATILLALQPLFLKKLAPKPRNAVMEAGFSPKTTSPFLYVKELLVQREERPQDTIAYEQLRTRLGLELEAKAKSRQLKGEDQIKSLYGAAQEMGLQVPPEFLTHPWEAVKLVEKEKPLKKSKRTSWEGFLGGDGGNAAAPVSASQLREQETLDYIEKYHKIAIAEMEKFGIPASIQLAQGLVESRAGLSKLAKAANNHFGMKCFSRKCRKGHCLNFTDDTHKDFFRKYKSPWESWRAHSQLLAGGRYRRLKGYGRDYKQWAYGLKTLGYATDRTYAEKLIDMIEKYDLDRFDK